MGLKTLALPLVVLGVLSLLALNGMGSLALSGNTGFVNYGVEAGEATSGYRDLDGRLIAYSNQTLVSGLEDGHLDTLNPIGRDTGNMWWVNATGWNELVYNGVYGTGNGSTGAFSFTAGGVTVVGVLVVICGLAMLASFQIFSSGLSETGVSAVVKGSFFGFVFVLLALNGGLLLASLPVFGGLIYLVLSVVYVIGVVDMFGHPSGA